MNSGGNGKWVPGTKRAQKEQDRARFEHLTRPHVPALCRTALRMTGDNQVAEDLTQETCLRAYRAFEKFEDGTNYQAWIFRIMTNLCTDFLRRKSRAPFVDWDDGEVDAVLARYCSETEQPDIQLLHKTFRGDAYRAMARLAPEVRLVVSLALLDGFTYQEIAEVANCPVGTVRSRLNRGRQQLQKELREYMPVQDERRVTAVVPLATAKSTQ